MLWITSKVPESVEIQKHLTRIHFDDWLKNDIFHLRWWILFGLLLLLWLVWWFLLDKSRLDEVCLYTILIFIIILGVDEYGQELTLWDYPIKIIPIFPPLTSINLVAIPLTYSIIYQKFKTKKSFVIAALVASAVISYIIEPALGLGGFYQLLHWKYIFSFPVYWLVAMFARFVAMKVMSIST